MNIYNESESQPQEIDDSASTHDQDGIEFDQSIEDEVNEVQGQKEVLLEGQHIQPVRGNTRVKKTIQVDRH